MDTLTGRATPKSADQKHSRIFQSRKEMDKIACRDEMLEWILVWKF